MIDGGKGQLNAALSAFEALGVKPPTLISLAKQNEEIFVPGRSDPIVLKRTVVLATPPPVRPRRGPPLRPALPPHAPQEADPGRRRGSEGSIPVCPRMAHDEHRPTSRPLVAGLGPDSSSMSATGQRMQNSRPSAPRRANTRLHAWPDPPLTSRARADRRSRSTCSSPVRRSATAASSMAGGPRSPRSRARGRSGSTRASSPTGPRQVTSAPRRPARRPLARATARLCSTTARRGLHTRRWTKFDYARAGGLGSASTSPTPPGGLRARGSTWTVDPARITVAGWTSRPDRPELRRPELAVVEVLVKDPAKFRSSPDVRVLHDRRSTSAPSDKVDYDGHGRRGAYTDFVVAHIKGYRALALPPRCSGITEKGRRLRQDRQPDADGDPRRSTAFPRPLAQPWHGNLFLSPRPRRHGTLDNGGFNRPPKSLGLSDRA